MFSNKERQPSEYPPKEFSVKRASDSKAIRLSLALYGALVGVTACTSPDTHNTPSDAQPQMLSTVSTGNSEPNIPPLPSFRHLLLKLPADIRARVEELLERGSNSCIPLYTDDKHLLGMDKTTEDCFGTIFWAISGGVEKSPMKGTVLVRKLTELGYRKQTEFKSYAEKPTDGSPPPIASEAMSQNLVPGDVLIFLSLPDCDIISMARFMSLSRHHAALYLGEVDGHHVIFHKPDPNCGDKSPYKITTMNILLDDGLSRRFYSTIAVYRR